MNLPLYIARRTRHSQTGRRTVSGPVVRIAVAGVAIGVAVMIISVSVLLGFKHAVRDKVAGFTSHITVAEFSSLHGAAMEPIVVNDSVLQVLRCVPGVAHVQRYTTTQGLLKTDDDFLGVAFKGIAQDYDTTFLHQNLVEGAMPHFSDSVASGQIVVSRIMARKLHLKAGESVFAYFFSDGNLRARKFRIAAIYETHLKRYDEALCYTDLFTTRKINHWEPDQAGGVEITATDFDHIAPPADAIVRLVNRTTDRTGHTYSSATVQELNPQIFSWLNLLDLNVWVILALMGGLAAFTIIAGLLIIILEHTPDIGLLKALGARNRTLRNTFLWLGLGIVGRGLVIGNLLAFALILLQRTTGIVHLDPDTCYVSTAPTEINIPIFLLINVAAVALAALILLLPCQLITHVQPAKTMKYE